MLLCATRGCHLRLYAVRYVPKSKIASVNGVHFQSRSNASLVRHMASSSWPTTHLALIRSSTSTLAKTTVKGGACGVVTRDSLRSP